MEDFWLRYDGKQMDEVGGRMLADYGIHDPSTEMEIFVRGLMGNTRTLWVKPSDTVKSVKLKDGDTLASCGIRKYSNMNLCYHFADSCDCICAHIETQRLIQKHQTLAQSHSTQPATEMQIYV
uniref:Ubiquitin-like domain-containing protein n=1 Tax=Oryza glumipatula TaxID=40148 RepID=A0A0E0BC33_9ORYZ